MKNRSLTIVIYKKSIGKFLFSVIMTSVVRTIRTISHVLECNVDIIGTEYWPKEQQRRVTG